MALPYGTTGSLCPAFAPARLVGLAVKLPFAIALYKAGYQSARGHLWKPPLRFWRRPPQSNYPPSSVRTIGALDLRQPKGRISRTTPTILAPTAASRRSLSRVSVPVWLVILSDQLEIVGLVSLYLTNYLIPLGLILWHVARRSHTFISRFYAVLATVFRRYPPP